MTSTLTARFVCFLSMVSSNIFAAGFECLRARWPYVCRYNEDMMMERRSSARGRLDEGGGNFRSNLRSLSSRKKSVDTHSLEISWLLSRFANESKTTQTLNDILNAQRSKILPKKSTDLLLAQLQQNQCSQIISYLQVTFYSMHLKPWTLQMVYFAF